MAPVITQPRRGQHEEQWRYGLFECCESPGDTCCAYCCGPLYSAYVSDLSGQKLCLTCCVCCCYPCGLSCLRRKIRDDKDIEGTVLKDIAVTCCCPWCSTVQMKREYDDE